MSVQLTDYIKDTRYDLLKVDNSNTGIDGTLRTVSSGYGSDTALKLSSSTVGAGNITLATNTISTGTGAITVNSASGVVNLGTSSASTMTIGNASGTVTINGTVSFGGVVSYTNVTVSGTLTVGTVATTSITIGGNTFARSGAHSLTITTTGSTSVTFPTSGTLVNSAVATLSSLTSVGTIATGTWNGTTIGKSYGGTGVTSLTTAGDAVLQASQTLVQRVATTVSLTSGTATIPADNTAPQSSEGGQVVTLAITPKSASNILEIEFYSVGTLSTGGHLIAALFQDSTASALAADAKYVPVATAAVGVIIKYRMTAGTTSSTTFKIRAGGNVASTWTITDNSSWNLGGTLLNNASFAIKEYAA